MRPRFYCYYLTRMKRSLNESLVFECDADREKICMISQTTVQVMLCITHSSSTGSPRNTLVHLNHGTVTASETVTRTSVLSSPSPPTRTKGAERRRNARKNRQKNFPRRVIETRRHHSDALCPCLESYTPARPCSASEMVS